MCRWCGESRLNRLFYTPFVLITASVFPLFYQDFIREFEKSLKFQLSNNFNDEKKVILRSFAAFKALCSLCGVVGREGVLN